MGTRGLYGFIKGGVEKVTYKQLDSDPPFLGSKVTDFIKQMTDEKLEAVFDNIVLVNEDVVPSEDELAYIKASGQSLDMLNGKIWYDVIRGSQGNFSLYAELAENNLRIYMTDDSDYILNSLYCEYAYYINLDSRQLEFWKGWQLKPSRGNRYGKEKYGDTDFYPCKMLKKYPFDEVRSMQTDLIVKDMVKRAKANRRQMQKVS